MSPISQFKTLHILIRAFIVIFSFLSIFTIEALLIPALIIRSFFFKSLSISISHIFYYFPTLFASNPYTRYKHHKIITYFLLYIVFIHFSTIFATLNRTPNRTSYGTTERSPSANGYKEKTPA